MRGWVIVIHVFFGHDERAEAGTTAFVRSVIAHAKRPIALIPLSRMNWPGLKEGSNAFTFRRFLVPHLMGYSGHVVFVDGADMLCRANIEDIMDHAGLYDAVTVVKHEYKTKHQRKYVGAAMESANEDYPRKQWASVMIINCGHFAWRKVTPEFIEQVEPLDLLQLNFLPQERIGSLPIEWNWLCDEHGENENAKLIHFTAGIPAFKHYADSPMAHEWRDSLQAATQATGGA